MIMSMCLWQPHSPDNRGLARECKDVKIDRVYIGSCTGGKTEDFVAAAELLAISVCSEKPHFYLFLSPHIYLPGMLGVSRYILKGVDRETLSARSS